MEEQNINWQKYGFFILLAIFLGFMVQIFRLNSYLNKEKIKKLEKKTDMQTQFLASIVGNFLKNSQAHLNSFARVPAATIFESGSTITEKLKAKQHEFNQLVQSYQFHVGLAYEKFLGFRNNMLYWSELPAALVRRIAHEFMFIDFEPVGDSPRGLLLSDMTVNEKDVLRISRNADFSRQIIKSVVEYMQNLFKPLVGYAKLFDLFLGWEKKDKSWSRNEFEVFLSKALSRNSFFTTVSLYNLNGTRQAFFSLEGTAAPKENINKICRHLEQNKTNWWGKIRYGQKLEKTFVNMASVVRDKNRKIAGFVLAQLDLKPVTLWLSKFSILNGKQFIISDGNKFVHSLDSKPSFDDCSKLLQDVEAKVENVYENQNFRNVDGWNIFYTPLAGFYSSELPAWKLFAIEQNNDTNHIISAVSIILVIVLAVIAFYVLFYRFGKSES